MKITEELQLTDEKPAMLQIKNTDKSQVIAIGLKENQVLKKHVTSSPALLVMLKGKIAFEMEEAVMPLSSFDTFDIPANVPHEVIALEESIFLLIKEKA